MPDRTLTGTDMLALLAAAPQRITAATTGLSPAQMRTPPAHGEWSANDVLAHLRACADMWGGYIARIIAEDHPTMRAINPRAWINQTDYLDLDFQPSLEAFTTQRADLLALLEPLPSEGWSRAATVTGAGKPLYLTVTSYVDRLALHERPHIKQIERVARALPG